MVSKLDNVNSHNLNVSKKERNVNKLDFPKISQSSEIIFEAAGVSSFASSTIADLKKKISSLPTLLNKLSGAKEQANVSKLLSACMTAGVIALTAVLIFGGIFATLPTVALVIVISALAVVYISWGLTLRKASKDIDTVSNLEHEVDVNKLKILSERSKLNFEMNAEKFQEIKTTLTIEYRKLENSLNNSSKTTELEKSKIESDIKMYKLALEDLEKINSFLKS